MTASIRWPRPSLSRPALLLAAGLLFFLGSSQTSAPPPGAELLSLSRKLSAEGYFDSAYAAAKAAEQAALASGNRHDLAGARLERGKYLARHGYPEQAAPLLDSLLAMEGELGRLYPILLAARGERADAALAMGNLPEHLARYRALAPDCEKLPATDDSLRAVLFQWIGQAYSIHDSMETALHYLRRSLDCAQRALAPDHLQIGYCHNSLAILHNRRGEPAAAIRNMEAALHILQQRLRPGHSHLIQVRSNLASLYMDGGLFWQAIRVLEQNLPLLAKVSPNAQYSSLYNYATARHGVGDEQTALAYLDQAEALVRSRPGLVPDADNRIFFLRAAAHQALDENERALQYIGMGIQREIALHGPDHPSLLTDYQRQGSILTQMKRYPEAVAALQEALRLAQRQRPLHAMRSAWAWESLGEVYLEQGAYAQALDCFRQAAPLYRDPQAQWNLADTYRHMARAWRGMGQADSNWHYVQKAWAMALPELPFEEKPGSAPLAYWHRILLFSTLQEQAESLHDRALRAGAQGCTQAEAAAACLKACVALVDSQAFYVEMPGSRGKLHASRTALLARLAAWEQDFAALGPCYPSQAMEIFRLAEAGRSVTLREHLRGQALPRFAGVPDSLTERESRLRQQLAALAQADPAGGESEGPGETQRAFLALRQEYRQLIGQIQAHYPAYYQLRYAAAPPDVAALQARLAPDQLICSFLASGDSLLAFQLRRDHFQMYRVPASLDAGLRRWLAFVSQPPGSGPGEIAELGELAQGLRAGLLPGLPPDLGELLIIPDGLLHSFPFETLPLRHPEGINWREWPFLGLQIRVTTVHAAELWMQASEQQPSWSAPAYAGFAPGFEAAQAGSVRGGLAPLAYSRAEVEGAAARMGGTALTGSAASETALKRLRGQPLLHLATHAIADEDQPMQSRLYLSPDSASGEDGILHAHEIYGLRLGSPLAVLSACETGAGAAEPGEGLKSLARAFQYAGCRQLLTTRWPADDPSTARLMAAFLDGIAGGSSSSEALRQARVSYLAGSDLLHSHPYYWAHLMLIGDGGPLRRAFPWAWAAAGLLVCLIAAAAWRRTGWPAGQHAFQIFR